VSIHLNYPHDTRTHEPLLLTRRDLWQLAEDARMQVAKQGSPLLPFADLVATARKLRINGIELETRWDFAEDVRDELGHQVMGAIDYDPGVRRTALIYLNSTQLADRDELIRSTAAHELAHAIFDAPGWMLADEKSVDKPKPSISYRAVVRRFRSQIPQSTMEWRANEFMGAFLAPPQMVRRRMLKVIATLGLPRCAQSDGKMVLDARKLEPYHIQAVIDELAEQFGLTIRFMEYRFHCYQLARKANP